MQEKTVPHSEVSIVYGAAASDTTLFFHSARRKFLATLCDAVAITAGNQQFSFARIDAWAAGTRDGIGISLEI